MFEFDLVSIGLTIFNLTVLFLILRKLFWKPIQAFLEKRRELINNDLDSAQQSKEEAANLLKEHQRLVAHNKQEAAKIIEGAVQKADQRKDEIIAQAGQEATALVERAKAEIALERIKAVEELRAEVSLLAVAVAEKLLARSLSDGDRADALATALEEVDSHVN